MRVSSEVLQARYGACRMDKWESGGPPGRVSRLTMSDEGKDGGSAGKAESVMVSRIMFVKQYNRGQA